MGADATIGQNPHNAKRTLAEKIDRLFATVRSPGGGEFTLEQVADAINRHGETTLTSMYLSQLRRGQRTNPTKSVLEALAWFFHVSPAYFFDDEAANLIYSELGVLAAMRVGQVRRIAARLNDLSPEALDTVEEIVASIRRLQGLPATMEPGQTTGENEDDG